MDRDTLFLQLQSKQIKTAKNVGAEGNPAIEITLVDGDKVIANSEFLEKYKVCLSVDKGKPEKWYVKEKN